MIKSKKILSYYSMRSLFMGIGLSRILSSSKEYFFLSFFIGTVLGIFLIKFIKKNNNKFINILSSFLILLFILVISTNMISTMYLINTPKIFIIISFILLVIYILNKNDINIYRISNILIVFNLLLFFIALFSLIKEVDLNNLYFTSTSIYNVFLSSIEYTLYSTIPFLIIRDDDVNYINTYIYSSVSMLIIAFVTYSMLGDKMVGLVRYPEYVVLKKVNLNNIENILSFMWIIDLFITYLAHAKNILYYSNKLTCFIFIFVSLIITLIINSHYELILLLYKSLPFFLLFILLLIFITNKKVHD